MSLCRTPNSAAVVSNSMRRRRLLLEKRLVNSKPLSVWTHSTLMPRRTYHFTSRFRKSAEELDTLARIGHLLIGFGLIFLLFLTSRKQSQLLHNPVQALRAPAIASLLQMPPELNQTQARIPAAHVSDQLQLILGMLIRMAVRPFGLTVILYMIAKTKSLCYTL